jgi:hypothetical protein
VKDFQARTESERKWLTGATYSPEFRKWEDSGSPNRPYYLGFNECIENAAARVRNPKWQVSFYFDRQNVLAPYALEYYQRAKVLAPPRLAKRLGDITFKSSAGVGALQIPRDTLDHALDVNIETSRSRPFRDSTRHGVAVSPVRSKHARAM